MLGIIWGPDADGVGGSGPSLRTTDIEAGDLLSIQVGVTGAYEFFGYSLTRLKPADPLGIWTTGLWTM